MPDNYWTGYPLLEAGLPWLTPGAIEAIANIVKPHFRILEFGAGGSTLFFSRRCWKVITWEINPKWLLYVKARVPDSARLTITSNLETIWSLTEPFDVVLVDSDGEKTDRQAICPRALNMVAPGGWFILDNYARYGLKFLAGWNTYFYDDSHWSGRGTLIACHH